MRRETHFAVKSPKLLMMVMLMMMMITMLMMTLMKARMIIVSEAQGRKRKVKLNQWRMLIMQTGMSGEREEVNEKESE